MALHAKVGLQQPNSMIILALLHWPRGINQCSLWIKLTRAI